MGIESNTPEKSIPMDQGSDRSVADLPKGSEEPISNHFSMLETQSAEDANRRLKTLARLMPSGMFIVDIQKRIRFWNRAAEQITGLPFEAVAGKFCMDTIHCQSLEDRCPLEYPHISKMPR